MLRFLIWRTPLFYLYRLRQGAQRLRRAVPTMSGADLIAAERQRQITAEGYNALHDMGHSDELAIAAATYALPEDVRTYRTETGPPGLWPWGAEWWKPTPDDRRRELVKAGALVAAAIDALGSGLSEGGE